MQTIASKARPPARRQASARESRWNWSHETGKIFSGLGLGTSFGGIGSSLAIASVIPLNSLRRRRLERIDPLDHLRAGGERGRQMAGEDLDVAALRILAPNLKA